jgi:hypothetical protein
MDPELLRLADDADLALRLNDYFDSVETQQPLAAITEALGLLSFQQAARWTEDFRSFHPLVRSLRGIVLDDADTSNHHIVLCASPVKAMVLYLDHGGDSRIVFEDIESFREAAARAGQSGGLLENEHPVHSPPAKDQTGLRNLMSSLRSQPDGGEDVLPPLVPSLDLSDAGFLLSLIDDDDFVVAEAIGRAVALRPAPHLLPVAEACERSSHAMVRTAGAMARATIAAL